MNYELKITKKACKLFEIGLHAFYPNTQ